jgi:CRISPR-associated protein Csd1
MILQSLHALYERLKDDPDYSIPQPGYSLQKITFRIVLSPNGELFDIQDARTRTEKQLRPQQRKVLGAGKPSGSGLNPCFLWDNTVYMLGYKIDDPKPERTLKAFEAFRDKHLGLESEINSSAFSTVCRFLENWCPDTSAEHDVLKEVATGFGVFQILGETAYVHEESQIREWWERNNAKDDSVPKAQCLITGELAPIARLQGKIKGVAGGKAEASLVSFNETAYESYGKEQGFNAPVSEQAAVGYAAALNAILDGPMSPKHRLRLGDMTVAFWTGTSSPVEDIFAQFLSEGSTSVTEDKGQDEDTRKKLEVFLTALRKGKEVFATIADNAEQTPFFILGLSPNAARLSVRFFHATTLGKLLDHIRSHYHDTGIERQFAEGSKNPDPEFPPAWLLLRQSARDSKEIPPVLAGALLRSIISGIQYPQALYAAVIRRIRADRRINYPRACVIKGYLTRNLKKEVTMSLDKERSDPPYRLGRLFAALEKTQVDALPGINATIRDHFYGAASATPRSVFPRLLRTYQHHLSKLEGGHKVNREKLVQEIMDPIKEFASHLNLAEQGLFAIGYYHQTKNFYTKQQS